VIGLVGAAFLRTAGGYCRAVRSPNRVWTRLGTAALAAHVFYELAGGVAMPFASRIGPRGAAALWGAAAVVAYREAGRRPPSADPAFATLNGVYLSAVTAHFAGWPRTTRLGLPWLTECEGLSGRAVVPYNLILHVSAVAGLAGLAENRRGRPLGLLVPVALVPWLVREQHREFSRLVEQAHREPGWWNRRLRAR